MTKLRYNPPRTPGGHLPPDTWHRQEAEDNEDLAKIVAQRQRRHADAAGNDSRKKTAEVGARVRVRDCDNGTTTEYEIVEPGSSDPAAGRISTESPVGSALLARYSGEIVEVEVPTGMTLLEIVEIK